METKLEEQGKGAVLSISGQMNTQTAKEIRDVFQNVAERYDDLTLDMQGVKYVSSAGIRELRDLYMAIYNKKGIMKMIHVNEVVMKVLEMTGMTGLLEIKAAE